MYGLLTKGPPLTGLVLNGLLKLELVCAAYGGTAYFAAYG